MGHLATFKMCANAIATRFSTFNSNIGVKEVYLTFSDPFGSNKSKVYDGSNLGIAFSDTCNGQTTITLTQCAGFSVESTITDISLKVHILHSAIMLNLSMYTMIKVDLLLSTGELRNVYTKDSETVLFLATDDHVEKLNTLKNLINQQMRIIYYSLTTREVRKVKCQFKRVDEVRPKNNSFVEINGSAVDNQGRIRALSLTIPYIHIQEIRHVKDTEIP